MTSNRELFNNFSIDVITPKLINKATSLDEFTILLSLYPNIIECFKILSYESVLKKLSIIYKKEKKSIKLISIQKPNENDDIESLSDSFMNVYENLKKEENPLIIDEDFFIEYYKVYAGKIENYPKNIKNLKMLEK